MGSDTIAHLNTIKKAIIKVSELENSGEMVKAKELKESLKKALIKRATAIQRLPTPMIDFLSGEKYGFDSKMFSIMSSKKILPKS
jgi:pyridoxal biosynthesis lyase PdxS